MPNSNHAKGAETERMVAKYLRDEGMWMAERYLREGRTDDRGDIEGVPFTTVQVKRVEQRRLQTWITATLKQRDTAGTPFCLLIHRVMQKPPAQWDAWMPYHQVWPGEPYQPVVRPEGGRPDPETEAWTWVRMDLRLAVAHLRMKIGRHGLSPQSLSTTSPSTGVQWVRWEDLRAEALAYARSMGNDGPASATT